jgi:hypothetical protein
MDDFADHVYNIDSVVGLDVWQLNMLNRVKKSIAFEVGYPLEDDSEASTTETEYSGEESGEDESGEDESGEDESGEDFSEGSSEGSDESSAEGSDSSG